MTGAWFSPSGLERLAGSLLHFVWQGAAIALLAALALHLLKHRSARSRYAAASLALLLMLAAPLATFVFYTETGALAQWLLGAISRVASTAAADATDASVARWTEWIVLLWAAGVAVCLIRLLAGWFLSRGLVRSATSVFTPVVLDVMQRARAALGFHRPVRLLAGAHIETPVVVGWLRPAILLPASALTGLDAPHLLAILAHELAHVRRHDFLVNAVQRVVECILFYHPAVWWVSGRIRVERERCCDDVAVDVCGDTLVYARALVALEHARSSEPVLAVAATGHGLTDRVRRILGVGGRGFDWQSSVAVLMFAALLGSAGLWHPVSAEPAVSSVATVQATGPIDSARPGPASESLNALAAIVTARSAQTAPQPKPVPAAPASRVTEPAIAPARAAAREKLGQLRVDYSADSFVKQAAEGDTIAVKLFLVAGMNINARDHSGATALIAAAKAGQTETVRSLVAAGADVNLAVTVATQSSAMGSALLFAAERGHLDIVKVLLAGGASVDSKVGSHRETALLAATAAGRRDAAALLLDEGADIEATGFYGTPLMAAACNRYLDLLRLMMQRGANVNATHNDVGTALHCAVQNRDLDAIELLLGKGADINAVTASAARTPLLRVLLEGAPPLGRNTMTPETTAVAKMLIDRGANVNVADKAGWTPLLGAIRLRDADVVRALLAKGADPNRAGPGSSNPLAGREGGTRPLQAAAGNDEIVWALTEAGAKP